MVGATTENPSFQVIAPLLSRCRVLVLQPLSAGDLDNIISRALEDSVNGLGAYGITVPEDVRQLLIELADGDAEIV